MKLTKIVLPLLVVMAGVPTSAQAANSGSSLISILHGLIVVPTGTVKNGH